MTISQVTAIAAGVVVLGGGIAFVATRDDPPPETVTPSAASPDASTSFPAPGAAAPEVANRPLIADAASIAGDAADYSPNEELARLEAMSPHPGKDEFARRLSVKHDQLLEDLTKDLGLSNAQAVALKEVLGTRLDAFRAALETGPQPGDSEQESLRKEEEMVVNAGEIIRGAGLREDLMNILSDEQLAAFDEREAEAWRTQVESHAYVEFSKLAPVLALTEKQKDRVFERLQASSDETLRANAAERAFIAMQKRQAATQMDLTDPVEMQFIIETLEGPDPPAPDSPEFKQRVIEVVGGRINERVKRLAPVLDEQQTQRYRDYLVQQSLLSNFGIELPTPE